MRTEQPMFGLGLQGKSPNVTANKLVNAYYEFQQQPDRTKVAIYGTPGLTLFIDKGDTPWRGLHPFPGNSLLYGLHRGTFYEVNNAGVVTSRGTIGTTSGRVDMADDGRYIVVVDGDEIYTYDTQSPATPIAAVADADRPTAPNTAAFLNLRILTDEDDTGQFKGAGLNDPTSWNALHFATAEANPDNLVRVVSHGGTLVLFGEYTTEFWQDTGGSGFPFARIPGAVNEYGLAARWSLGRLMGSYAFLSRNREGQVHVAMLNGYSVPQRISNPELEFVINRYSTVSDATGFGYMLGGHPMYQLNFPNEGKSWLYDGSTQYWSELRHGANSRHRADIAVDYLNRTVVSDYENGKLYRLDADIYSDNGESIHMILRGRHIHADKRKVRFDRLELGLEPGVGTASVTDPVAGLRISKDGGHTFGTQTFMPLGNEGEYTSRCVWRNLGSGRDIMPEITITDQVKRVITDCTLVMQDGLS